MTIGHDTAGPSHDLANSLPSTLNVLVVDDDRAIQQVMQLALEGVPGWTVRLAGTADEALEAACTEPPDVILLDLMMPGVGGAAAARLLRADSRTGGIPIVYVTAKSARSGGNVIAKPFDVGELPSLVVAGMSASIGVDQRAARGADSSAVRSRLDEIWVSERAESLRRVHAIEEALRSVVEGSRSADLFEVAREELHKLRGSAGVFGRVAISDLASEVEQRFHGDDATEASQLLELVDAIRLELVTS